jgi:hypothetical protein
LAAAETVVSCAKSYIVKNADRVTDWSGLNIRLKSSNGEWDYYYKHTVVFIPKGDGPLDRVLREFEEHCRDNEQQVREIDTITLDTSDGDLSITVNGKEYIAIGDREVIDLAAYIEKNS